MPVAAYGSRVYQYRSKNSFKESWLSLEENGTLNWKRRDAFLPLASIPLVNILDRIEIGDAWRVSEDQKQKPFFLSIPIRPNRSPVKFAFMQGQDLELWLNAFAEFLGLEELYKSIKRYHADVIVGKNSMIGEVEKSLPYLELVSYYKAVWQDFLAERNGDHSSHLFEEEKFDYRQNKLEDNRFNGVHAEERDTCTLNEETETKENRSFTMRDVTNGYSNTDKVPRDNNSNVRSTRFSVSSATLNKQGTEKQKKKVRIDGTAMKVVASIENDDTNMPIMQEKSSGFVTVIRIDTNQ